MVGRGEHLSSLERSARRSRDTARGSAGLLVVWLLVLCLLLVELFLDLGVAHQVVGVRLHLLRLDNLFEALTNIVIRRRLQIARLYQLDHMPAVLGLNRLVRVFTGLERQDGVGERLDHLVW